MLIELTDEAIGDYVASGNPMKMSLTPPVIEKTAPLLGADTDRVLAELGYSADEITKLHEVEVI